MKTLWTTTLCLFISFAALAQSGSRYQTYKSVMTIIASKNGVTEEWKNDRLSVVLDYKNGDFILKLYNDDFKNTDASGDTPNENRVEYSLQGIFPINDIIDQKQISQTYDVELQLVNFESRMNQTLNFEVNVTNPGTSQSQYRIFILQGSLYNDEVNLPAFKGYDNEVEINIAFNGYIVTQ